MRYKIHTLLAFVFVQSLIFLLIWSLLRKSEIFEQQNGTQLPVGGQNSVTARSVACANKTAADVHLKPLLCNINGEYNISCRKESDEVYVPFSFIKKYFDISGKLVERNGVEMFNWSHSYANVYIPTKKYSPHGPFTHFQSYKVEERERVKCISAAEGVPLSTQWNPNGYHYPTQIAQFGLSHYSKSLLDPEPIKRVIEDGKTARAYWIVPSESTENRVYDYEANSIVMCFNTTLRKPISLKTNITLPIIAFNLKLKSDNVSRFTISVRNVFEQQTYSLHYTCENEYVSITGYDIFYGLFCGEGKSTWYKLSRDVLIDLQKGLMLKMKTKPKLQRSSFKIDGFYARGEVCVDNLTSLSSDHMTQFQFTADWLVKHQDELTGGWPNLVTRKMAGSLILKPGWYSAMGQGHGLSVLTRAYFISKKETKYLEAARKALNPFNKLSNNRGVLAMFLDHIPWYEEYPTKPPVFVLNGFIYSLIGLYDFYNIAPSDYSYEPYMLYAKGMKSLKKLLLTFDTGSGTTYDLRHITLGVAPRLARWDYHATHINQLYLLASIDPDPLFLTTAKRWLGYMYGKRASHN